MIWWWNGDENGDENYPVSPEVCSVRLSQRCSVLHVHVGRSEFEGFTVLSVDKSKDEKENCRRDGKILEFLVPCSVWIRKLYPSKSPLQRPSATTQRLAQRWKRRGRAHMGLAEIAATLGLSGSESHSSCAFQRIVQLTIRPKPSERRVLSCSPSPTAPHGLTGEWILPHSAKKRVLCSHLI